MLDHFRDSGARVCCVVCGKTEYVSYPNLKDYWKFNPWAFVSYKLQQLGWWSLHGRSEMACPACGSDIKTRRYLKPGFKVPNRQREVEYNGQ